jgi:hypothetical protein
MKHLLLFALLAGCVDTTPEESDVAQGIDFCPVEDQEAGLCNGPFTALMKRTREEIPPEGTEVVSQAMCGGMQGEAVCHVMYTIPLILVEIVVTVTCTKAANGAITCVTTVH